MKRFNVLIDFPEISVRHNDSNFIIQASFLTATSNLSFIWTVTQLKRVFMRKG